jgi:hypothetical protein
MPLDPKQIAEWKRLLEAASHDRIAIDPWNDRAEDEDEAFFAAAREALPLLIAEVERLNAERTHGIQDDWAHFAEGMHRVKQEIRDAAHDERTAAKPLGALSIVDIPCHACGAKSTVRFGLCGMTPPQAIDFEILWEE